MAIQPEINIGTLGHVDNGKSTLVQALTGVWTGRHSEELRRGITIRIGYADATFYKCNEHDPPIYTVDKKCPSCSKKTEFIRMVSFVDCPGHHSLMVTMISGAALMDGALFVIPADAKCPQAQDREHMIAAQMSEVGRMILVQNKIDLVDRDRAIENYYEIEKFTKEHGFKQTEVIPISAQHKINIDEVIKAIEKNIPTPKRDPYAPPQMYILRSFDVNKPGTKIEKMLGGVIGGSIIQGVFHVGDEIEVRPGLKIMKGGKTTYSPLLTEIVSLGASTGKVDEAKPGGLIGVGTFLDPSLTKSDGLVGNMLGKTGTLPEVIYDVTLETTLFEKAVGTEELVQVERIKTNEALVLNVATAVTSGIVKSAREDVIDINLKKPVCVESKSKIAISRRIGEGWRLIGYGNIK